MLCITCKTGKTKKGKSVITLQKSGAIFVIKNVPAQVCRQCREAYFSSEITAKIQDFATKLTGLGIETAVINFEKIAD